MVRMGRQGQRARHNLYYDLRDACREEGCPVCTVAGRMVARYLEAVIGESVNDPPIRDAVTAARGYCNSHSWTLRELNAGLGTAMMYGSIIRRVADGLTIGPSGSDAPPTIFPASSPRRTGGPRRWFSSLLTRAGRASAAPLARTTLPDPHRTCPACLVRERHELNCIDTLLGHIRDADGALSAAFEGSGGLCLVHLDQMMGAARDRAALARLLELQQGRMRALGAELAEFIRKHDYRFTGEGMGAEGTSWQRAIDMVAGKRGVR